MPTRRELPELDPAAARVPLMTAWAIVSGAEGTAVTDRKAELAPVPRVALRREEAAASMAMSLDSFERYVQPYIRMMRLGSLRIVAVSELERFAQEAGEGTLP